MKRLTKVLVAAIMAFAMITSVGMASADSASLNNEFFNGIWEDETNSDFEGQKANIFFCTLADADNAPAEYGVAVVTDAETYYYKAKAQVAGKYGIALYGMPDGAYSVYSYTVEGEEKVLGSEALSFNLFKSEVAKTLDDAKAIAKAKLGVYADVIWRLFDIGTFTADIKQDMYSFSAAKYGIDTTGAVQALDAAADFEALSIALDEQNEALKLATYKAMAKYELANIVTTMTDMMDELYDKGELEYVEANGHRVFTNPYWGGWYIPKAYTLGYILTAEGYVEPGIDSQTSAEGVMAAYNLYADDVVRAICQHNVLCYDLWNTAKNPNYGLTAAANGGSTYWWFVCTYFTGQEAWSYIGDNPNYTDATFGPEGDFRLTAAFYSTQQGAAAFTPKQIMDNYNWMINNQLV